jgi:hypothetical protein
MTTLLDVQLARLLYPLVIDIAQIKRTCTYSDLIAVAKARYPDDQRIANLIPVRMGRILWVIYNFVEARDYPRLTLVIVSKTDKYPGSAMWQHDCELEQQRCFDFDWSTVDREFDLYGEHTERAVTPVRRIRRDVAKQLMSEHYYANRADYPANIAELRETIIENIVNGMSVEEAFEVEAQLLKG